MTALSFTYNDGTRGGKMGGTGGLYIGSKWVLVWFKSKRLGWSPNTFFVQLLLLLKTILCFKYDHQSYIISVILNLLFISNDLGDFMHLKMDFGIFFMLIFTR